MTTRAPAMNDDELVIETPERVELYYTRAQVGNRFLAALVDHTIQLLTIAALAFVLALFGNVLALFYSAFGDWAIAAAILSGFFIFTGYFVVFETLWSGQTPGKRMFRLRVIRDDGRPIRFYEAMVRNLLRTGLDSMPVLAVVPFYSVGLVSVFLSSRSKRLGDYVAGTVVIREGERRAPTLDEVESLARDTPDSRERGRPAPFVVEPRLMSQDQVRALRAFLRRRYDLPYEARRDLAFRIVVSLAASLSIPQVQLAPEEVLEEVDRQARAAREAV
jgi:uncharacterized RDD family membrane protein YckC